MFRIVSTKRIAPALEEMLSSLGAYVYWPSDGVRSDASLVEAIRQADAFLTQGSRIDEALLGHAPRLRVVSTPSVGYDHFDLAAMARHRVIGTHTPGVLDDTVADLAMALVLASARRIVELDGWVRGGRWVGGGSDLFGIDVHHRTIGIIGMGRIGQAVARRAHFGFDMQVLYHSRTRHFETERLVNATYMGFEDLLAESDFVVLLTPLTQETAGLMDAQAFARMRSSSIFINVSRGKTVNESDLYHALASGQIRAAGLDVFVQEPAVPWDYMMLENVVVLPHIGSATRETRLAMGLLALEGIVAVLAGHQPANLVR